MQRLILDQISVDDLVSRVAIRVREEIQNSIPSPELPEKYITRKVTAKLLQISLVTLNKWSKKGIIQSYRIGGRVLYKSAEIDEALKEVKNLKYRRE